MTETISQQHKNIFAYKRDSKYVTKTNITNLAKYK